MPLPLSQQSLSLDHAQFIDRLATTENLLLIQDLDGVCMELVKDPLDRQIDLAYVRATMVFDQHFYVLTNGEHIGKRGVNRIIDRAIGQAGITDWPEPYLPGLAAGGVQWQDRSSNVTHLGVSQAELAFLAAVPDRITATLRAFFAGRLELSAIDIEQGIPASVLANHASPTVNLNTFYALLDGATETYRLLQQAMQMLMRQLLRDAAEQGINHAFFMHYAPNLGHDELGQEIVWFTDGDASGTTDFQFMLKGGIKEAGVLVLLNRYYFDRTGTYPLGQDFNVRQAPPQLNDLVELVVQKFDRALMPTIIGVGDTVTSQGIKTNGELIFQRGGSDRNFLQLIQHLGVAFEQANLTVYVDSSGGELQNRQALKLDSVGETVIEGPGDARDTGDPLKLNVAFPGGYRQYCQVFQVGADRRRQSHTSPEV
jgi:glucosylglycerol 3-phosphatase